MNTRIPRWTYAALLLGAAFTRGGAQPLTLRGAVAQALLRNERIRQYEERLRQKDCQNLEAWGNFLPTVSITASATHLNDPLEIDLAPLRQAMISLQSANQAEFANAYNRMAGGAGLTAAQRAAVTATAAAALNNALPPFVETLKEQDYRTATVTAVQPLFLGGKLIAAKRYASAEQSAASIELDRMRHEVIQEVTTQYLGVVLLTGIVHARQNVLDGMRRHQHDAHRLQQEGLIAAHQALRADVAVAEAERNLQDDENRRDLALLALRNSIGLAEDLPVDVQDSLTFHPMPDRADSCLALALRDQPALRLIAEKRTAASQKFNAERAEFLPQVAAFGKYEMYPQYLSALEPRWAVGLQVSLNVFNGGRKYARLQAASHLEDEVDHIDADARRSVRLLVRKDFTDLRNARVRYTTLASNISLAEENLRLMNARFQTGLGTSLDVIDARLLLEKNEVERLQSLYDYYRSAVALATVTGAPERFVEQWNSQEN